MTESSRLRATYRPTVPAEPRRPWKSCCELPCCCWRPCWSPWPATLVGRTAAPGLDPVAGRHAADSALLLGPFPPGNGPSCRSGRRRRRPIAPVAKKGPCVVGIRRHSAIAVRGPRAIRPSPSEFCNRPRRQHRRDPDNSADGRGPSRRVPAQPRVVLAGVLAAVWALGTFLGLVWLGIGVVAAWYVARRAKPAADPDWHRILRQLLEPCGFRRPIAVRRVPASIGSDDLGPAPAGDSRSRRQRGMVRGRPSGACCCTSWAISAAATA